MRDLIDRDLAIEILTKIPTANARENVLGNWKQISPARIYECSECKQFVMTDNIDSYKYCHHCGAKMGD